MRVGDEIRIFEITEKGASYYEGRVKKGSQLAEKVDSIFFGHQFGVDLVDENHYHFGWGMAKHVATMRITKLK